MAHDVFVSHSVKDKATAEKIVAYLERDSIRCWVAPRDVVPGADWGESIIDALESSRVMVLIFSAHANVSSQIKREVERAVDKNVYTIPLRIEDIEPTRSLEYFISTSQWMDAFPPPLEPHLERLSRTVKAILAKSSDVPPLIDRPLPAAVSPAPALSPMAVASSPMWMKPVAIAGALVVLLAGIWFLLGRSNHATDQEKHRLAEVTTAPSVEPAPAEYGSAPKKDPPMNQAAAQPANVLNQAALPEPTESLAPTYTKKGGFEPPPVPAKGAYSAALPVAEEPVAVVRRYYEDINRRDLDGAYASFSQAFKGRRSYDQFAQNFAQVLSISLQQANEAKRGESDADVSVAFNEVDAENHLHQWEGHVLLVKEGDAWRINQMPVKQRVAAPAKKY